MTLLLLCLLPLMEFALDESRCTRNDLLSLLLPPTGILSDREGGVACNLACPRHPHRRDNKARAGLSR